MAQGRRTRGGVAAQAARAARIRRGTLLGRLLVVLAPPFAAVLLMSGTVRAPLRFTSARQAPEPSPPSRPVFVEAASECGLEFRHERGATGRYYFPEIMGAGAALFDCDGDGDLDAYCVQSGPIDPAADGSTARRNRLYRNDADPSVRGARPRFIDVTDSSGLGDAGYGMGCAVGDYDNDGAADLFVTNFGRSRLYRNRGDGGFDDVTHAAGIDLLGWAASAAFVDYDHDRWLDLFVTFYAEYSLASDWPCHTLTGERDYCGPSNYPPAQARLLHNEGGRQFVDVTARAGLDGAPRHGLGVACGDLNGDGRTDLFVANDGDPNQLWINRGDGTFEDQAMLLGVAFNDVCVAEAGMGVTLGDADNDGDDDVFITHLTGEKNTLYVQDRGAMFTDGSAAAGLAAPSLAMTGFGTAFFDFDHDGWLDLFVTNGAVTKRPEQRGSDLPFRQTDQLFRNLGRGRFADVSAAAGGSFAVPAVGRGAAFGDVDNDGDVDVLVTCNSGAARLLLNQVGQERPWLRVRAIGTRSNRDGIGARVTLFDAAGSRLMHRHVHRDGSYLSANDVRVHFGLGRLPSPATVQIDWPSGPSERWPVVGVNRELVLVEESGEAVRP